MVRDYVTKVFTKEEWQRGTQKTERFSLSTKDHNGMTLDTVTFSTGDAWADAQAVWVDELETARVTRTVKGNKTTTTWSFDVMD